MGDFDQNEYLVLDEEAKTHPDRAAFLRDLADRLFKVAGNGEFDQWDIDELRLVANAIEAE